VGKSLQDRVAKIVADQLGITLEEVIPEASFIDDLGADSLDLVELIMVLEDKYGLDIKDEDAEKIKTVQDLINYVTEHTRGI
jgi:acyl carrier protein